MLVYHGTNCDIDEICLTRGSRYKDFGQGFYVTPDIETDVFLDQQICFATPRSLEYLTKQSVCQL